MSECFISVDIEATGRTPGKYSMYELGACVVRDEQACFTRKIQLRSKNSHDSETLMAMHIVHVGMLLERTDTHTPKRAMCDFAEWVKRVSGERTPVFVGNNAPFDWMFVAWYFEQYKIANPFGHSALDMKAYFMGLTNCAWKDATLKHMAEYAGILFQQLPHRAVEDAIMQSRIFSALLSLPRSEQ